VSRRSRQELTALGQERLAVAMDIHFAGVRRNFSNDLSDTETAMLAGDLASTGPRGQRRLTGSGPD